MEQSLQEQLSSLCSNNLYHIFEKNLTKADNDSPCADTFGYTKYDSTATHWISNTPLEKGSREASSTAQQRGNLLPPRKTLPSWRRTRRRIKKEDVQHSSQRKLQNLMKTSPSGVKKDTKAIHSRRQWETCMCCTPATSPSKRSLQEDG